MTAHVITCGEDRFRIISARHDDWSWIPDTIESSMMASLHPLYAEHLDRQKLREIALYQIKKIQNSKELTHEIFLALDEKGKRAGLIWLTVSDYQYTGEKRCFVLQIYVAPPYRRKGLGRALMKIAEEWARERGLRTIALHVGATNRQALEFYRALGFSEESVLMNKSLEDYGSP